MNNPATKHKFGRKPRRFNPRVPHLSALRLASPPLSPPPDAVDYTQSMPANFGMMLNDQLGDCTCAAYYHARQVWSFNAQGTEVTEPDADIEQMYQEACGYNPLVPGSDNGGDEQSVLSYLLNTGAPTGAGGLARDKILAFIEVDPRNKNDVKQTIFECGIAYIGFPVPANVNYDNSVWDYDPSAAMTGDGHAVVLAGYNQAGAIAISWGKLYTLTWAFIAKIVDEVYAIADSAWVTGKGTTPDGLSVAALESQMQALKVNPAESTPLWHRHRPHTVKKIDG